MSISFPSFRSPRPRRTAKRRKHSAVRESLHPSSTHPANKRYPHLSTQTRPQPQLFPNRRNESAQPKTRRTEQTSTRSSRFVSPFQTSLKRQLSLRQSRPRIVMVWGVLVVGMLLLTLNLFRIQVLQASMLKERAKAQQMIYLNPMVPRHPIVDRQGTVLAIDQPVYTLYAHPILFQTLTGDIAKSIAPILKQTPEEVMNAFEQGESGVRIVDGLTEDLARQISSLQVDGLELVQEQQRLYPQENLFANVVGYVNLDREGQSGVEYSLEGQLRQPIEAMTLSRSGDGTIMPIGLPSDFLQQQTEGLRLQLTLDSRLQRATRLALEQQMNKYKAKRGAVIVMDVHDGSILSLVSEPSYNPNRYYEANLESLRNWVLTDLYEPGSTFKPVNVAIALQSGAVLPTDTFYDEGAIEVGGWPIQNSDFESNGGRGVLSVSEILQYSSNVGMVRMMQSLQPGVYYGWLSRLDLNEKTGIDLPAEAVGQMKTYRDFTNASIEPATTAFGQGFSLTPIKLIQLNSMLANGGKLVTPHVVQGMVNPNGELTWSPTLPTPQQIFSPDVAKTVLDMMEEVVTAGTGQSALIPGYRIAGKTGTAQKAGVTGGYTDARITSFVSMFPVEDPQYAVLAVVDEPQGDDAYGSTVAAPVVKAVMEALIQIEQILPSQPIREEEAWIEDRESLPGNYVPDSDEDAESQNDGEEENFNPDPFTEPDSLSDGNSGAIE
ncbi:cell division protein FtsI [filamentous cyanobacterium CCP2]|nr:cell division protein FtsI [filamentous cyanobacterium CCP2]